jgi:uncharacterized membrane protein YvbJ
MKACYNCGGEVEDDAERCQFCGTDLTYHHEGMVPDGSELRPHGSGARACFLIILFLGLLLGIFYFLGMDMTEESGEKKVIPRTEEGR